MSPKEVSGRRRASQACVEQEEVCDSWLLTRDPAYQPMPRLSAVQVRQAAARRTDGSARWLMARASSWSFPAMNKAEALAVVMPEYLETRPDMASRLRKLRVFGQVIRNEDLSGFVVSHPLQGQVGDLNKWSGYRSLARAYEPFVFRFECVGARDRVRYRMIVTRADKSWRGRRALRIHEPLAARKSICPDESRARRAAAAVP
ncbi:MAG: hypothetical protein M0039_00060 [Pseudomonadota bacterium]|nr:hypothetical protein [Pseudomonadota bacterium]